jgi:hypothetical protein
VVHQLEAYMASCRGRHFSWQEWNCVHFAAGWVALIENRNILAHYNEVTSTQRCAARLAQRMGGLSAAVSRALDRQPVHIVQACVGDLMFAECAGMAGTLAICNGASAVALSEGVGFVPVPMQTFTHAWKLHREA